MEVKEFQPRRLETIPVEKAAIPIEVNKANANSAELEGNMDKQETKRSEYLKCKDLVHLVELYDLMRCLISTD